KIEAILNGTSNYILTNMRDTGMPFKDALNQAQDLGYAEADPANDVAGHDAMFKLMILSELAFKQEPDSIKVERIGISEITTGAIRDAARQNEKIKHVASVRHANGKLKASVKPVILEKSHPLFAVDGADNAIHISTNLMGHLTLIGPGAGARPTASAMIEDL